MSQHWAYKPKLMSAAFVKVMATIMVFADKMDGPTWVAACTLALGVYAGATVTENIKMKGAP